MATPDIDTLLHRGVFEIVVEKELRERLNEGKPLRLAFQSGKPHSMIFWGPPGVGKATTVADMPSRLNTLMAWIICCVDSSRLPAAAFMASLMACRLGGFELRKVRSTQLTFAVGTRKLMPVSLPFTAGRHSATAFAAPVLAGMMFW